MQNFMSHEFTVIEPVAGTPTPFAQDSKGEARGNAGFSNGLTVLIGDNNSGKSAVVSALQTVAQNASGDYMVRHGEKECKVIVETCECGKCFEKNPKPKDPSTYQQEQDEEYSAECPEGHVLIWRRIKKKTSYVVNGRVVDRLRGHVPDDLYELLRMPLVHTPKDTTFDIHFGEQKSPIFLLGDKPTDRAAFFASSSDTAKLIEMQQLHRNKIKDANAQQTTIREEQARFEKRRDILEPCTEIELAVEQAEKQFIEVEQHRAAIRSLSELINRLDSAKDLCRRHDSVNRALKSLEQPPSLTSTEPTRQLVSYIVEHRKKRDLAGRQIQSLSNCEPPPEIEKVEALLPVIDRIQKLQQQRGLNQTKLEVLEQLTSIPGNEIEQQISPLKRLIESLSNTTENVSREKKKLVKHELEKAEAEAALRNNLEDLDTCPTCGQRIDVETAVACAHFEPGSDSEPTSVRESDS